MLVGRAVLPNVTPAVQWHTTVTPNVSITEVKPTVAEVEARARAYEIAKAELPPTATRVAVMAAADEIFAYLMHGHKPTE